MVNALIDSGSSESFIHPNLVSQLALLTNAAAGHVTMASTSLSSQIIGSVNLDFTMNNLNYSNVKLNVMKDLCVDIILGLDFQSQHESITLKFGGNKPPLVICGLSTLHVSPPSLFNHLTPDCKPVATKSRRYSNDDRKFIDSEIQRMLQDGIIEPSKSPWRAQVVGTRGEKHTIFQICPTMTIMENEMGMRGFNGKINITII